MSTIITILIIAIIAALVIVGLKDGMHCMNCKNSVTRSLQKMSGVSADVDLKHGVAHVEATRELSDEEITFAIERLDFKVTGIERF